MNAQGEGAVAVAVEVEDPIFQDLEYLTAARLQAVIAARPDVIRVTDSNGWQVLHHIFHRGLTLPFATVVVRAWPGSVRRRPGRVGTGQAGPLPIHLANARTDPDVAALLINLYQEGLWVPHKYEPYTPLEPFLGAVKNGAPFAIVSALFAARYSPAGVAPRHDPLLLALREAQDPVRGHGRTALRLALVNRSTDVEVVRLLRRAWPDAVGRMDFRSWRTPLHLAVLKAASHEVVTELVQWRPAMVRERNEDGCLPSHMLDLGWYRHRHRINHVHADASAAQVLVNEWPGSLLEPNSDGDLPVHRVVQSGPVAVVEVEVLVGPSPESLRARNGAGQTPLMVALCQPQVSLEMVEYLVDQCPDALTVRDASGLLPLEVAASKADASLDVLLVLVSSKPECVFRRRAAPTDGTDSNPRSAKRRRLDW
jgi:hypothetical protein